MSGAGWPGSLSGGFVTPPLFRARLRRTARPALKSGTLTGFPTLLLARKEVGAGSEGLGETQRPAPTPTPAPNGLRGPTN